jgi:hypothetical protein
LEWYTISCSVCTAFQTINTRQTDMSQPELNHSPDRVKQIASLYPYIEGPNGYGIPFETIFTHPENKDYITGGSGCTFMYEYTSTQIGIYDISHNHFQLFAKSKGSEISFHIITRIFDGRGNLSEPHPDLFAGKFITLCLHVFPHTSQINALWQPNSINYYQFRNALNNGLSEHEAVQSTWSAQQFAENKFIFPKQHHVKIEPWADPRFYNYRLLFFKRG